ncbi:MAG: molybdopterin-dependent oxidoreductase [Candidatus Bipolaricaulota bacterium]|nr:molybdopterin-dependent oxidoreductase [Candidatus Bipolaricaulota bacterium]MDW8127094.1 hypothetical protein [Candidatus Bipolaricaulota bacterium]
MRILGLLLVAVAWTGLAQPVLIQMGYRSLALDFLSTLWPEWRGTLFLAGQTRFGQGLSLAPVIRALGGMAENDALFVFSPAKEALVSLRQKEALSAMLIFFVEGETPEEVPLLYLGGDEPRAYPVRWLILNWGGEKVPEVGVWPEQATLTLATPEGERTFTLAELETTFVALTYPGSYIRSSGEKVTAVWTGIPLCDLLGNWPADTEIEVVAADGYRMRYRYGALQDAEGIWLLAFKQDGKYLPFNPGYFRLVKAGPGNPSFQSAASARMVARIEVRGEYRPYSLSLHGAREHVFSRWDLEAGIACPCHARVVTSTHKGETHVYAGIPLWRLLAYVDDATFPPGAGLKYDDAAFNWELAKSGYLVEIRAADGFSQVIPSSFLAGEDRFILALKVDGRFLREDEGGPLLFVWDDSVALPAGLKRVKWVTEILIHRSD